MFLYNLLFCKLQLFFCSGLCCIKAFFIYSNYKLPDESTHLALVLLDSRQNILNFSGKTDEQCKNPLIDVIL